MSAINYRTVWQPQPGPQKILIDCPYKEIGYGGARGGGKTDGVLGKYAIKGEIYGKHFNAIFFRREMPQADDLIERAKEIYLPCGAEWHEQKKMFVLRGGGRVRFRPLENTADAEKYQGQNLTDAGVEEAGAYPESDPIDRLFGCLRSVGGVPTQLILTFNPGGPGHTWLRDRYVKPWPKGLVPLERHLPNGAVHKYIYIPARVGDNKLLLANDPDYINRLHLVGSPELVRAWLEGDFNIVIGSYFPEFCDKHIVRPFPIPRHWPRYCGFDWGYHSPFAAVFGAVSSGKDDNGREVPYPKDSIIIYRELWGDHVQNTEIAKRILEAGKEDGDIIYVADPAIFANEGGPSIADQFKFAGIPFKPADNERIGGWSEIRQRLTTSPPKLYISAACPYLLEQLSSLPLDERHPEDADTTAPDHACDALRYLCKERTLPSLYTTPDPPIKMGRVPIATYVNQHKKARNRISL